jgi:hypothetical protein
VTGPVASSVVKPVADAVAEPVAPVVRAGADVVAPVVRPVADVVAPVLRSVVSTVVDPVLPVVEPVLAAAAPVTEPLLTPVLDAAEPVVTPVTDAAGLADGADEVIGTVSGVQAPVDPSLPAERSVAPVHAAMSHSATPMASVDSGQHVSPASPGPLPGLPTVPVPFAATGGGVAGGTGGPHSGDAAVVGGSGGVVGHAASVGRSPPGTVVGAAWFGYDDRDHPS